MRRLFPTPLVPGMTVGLTAPASPVFEPERRDAAVRLLEEMGFAVRRGASVDAVDDPLHDSPRLRAEELTAMFCDSAVDGIVCLRGGYGSARLLEHLDYAAIARHPKPFIGFSDITALHAALNRRCGLVTYHGPMPGVLEPIGLREPRDRAMFLRAVSGRAAGPVLNPDGAAMTSCGDRPAAGRLLGGNLTVLCALCGTEWEPDFAGALLLLEDVAENEKSLRDKLEILARRGVFTRIAGLVLGDFSRCRGLSAEGGASLTDLARLFCGGGMPILAGLHAGHGRDRATLPLGALYRLDPARARLTLAENTACAARRP